MFPRTLLAALLVITFVESTSAQDKTGTLKILFKYKGGAPNLDVIRPVTDKQFCGQKPIPDERLIVNSDNNGIKNVVVFVRTGRRGTKLPPQKPSKRILKLDCTNCRFQPHILLGRVGDTVKLTNNGLVGHSINFSGFANVAGMAPPPGQSQKIQLVGVEPTLIPVDCNIHPWMKAYMLVIDHPFAGISDADGSLEIKGLPTETKLVFQVWHETGTFRERILINGAETNWEKNRFELNLSGGDHNMGTVEIPAEQFGL